MVNTFFLLPDVKIEACFTSAGDHREVRLLMEFLYYVASWHAHLIKRASIRRQEV